MYCIACGGSNVDSYVGNRYVAHTCYDCGYTESDEIDNDVFNEEELVLAEFGITSVGLEEEVE